MNSFVKDVGEMAETQVTKVRWALGINGALSVAAGVVILVWPGISIYALTILFGAYTAARGIVGLASAIGRTPRGHRGWLALSSLLSLAVGVMVLIWSDSGISELALLYVIGAYAIGLGIAAIVGGFWLPLKGGDTALLVLSGLVSILFGVVMFARPGAGALTVLALIAAFALVTGMTELVVAIGGKQLLEGRAKKLLHLPRSRPQAT
jgi:uncharacterized membrane protein HdeD (DUF308 family)